MAADYSPYVREYREATVMDVIPDSLETRLTLQLLGKEAADTPAAR